MFPYARAPGGFDLELSLLQTDFSFIVIFISIKISFQGFTSKAHIFNLETAAPLILILFKSNVSPPHKEKTKYLFHSNVTILRKGGKNVLSAYRNESNSSNKFRG